ncbi:hypothetical protein DCE79_05395 [Lysinibacillus sp. 2017]|uniref:hypothetical protein n=1 Tax=unclassified Lysinibacillus TaxID=2636778 RepID=UPI000D525A62|nr:MULTISPECIES: hypothetical protein [unclassified Lysinibacillus]AWE06867.1 hypothetical protein DCE79_05395 [Lysinibacillus sp. 2017]TGN37202.1 hypothetical protein E4L99_01600 [Lysinibacillus sp. S2017]
MRKTIVIQYTSMIVLCFICGVACYQLFQIDQVMQILEIGDRRLLTMDKPSLLWSVVPFIGALSVVLFFSTHKYLTIIAPIFIAIKVTFFGFSSVFLLVHHQSVKLYAIWWFPFQLSYCILLLALYAGSKKPVGRAMRDSSPKKRVLLVIILLIFLFSLENFAISYLFK